MTLLKIEHLKTYYKMRTGTLRAVDDIGFSLEKGESLGIAGESGCGKSTVALSIMRLIRGPHIMEGNILLNGQSLMDIKDKDYNKIRLQRIALISQAAMGGLNPVYTIGSQIAEPLIVHNKMNSKSALKKAAELLERVEIDPARIRSYPHELSGGMRQRVMIAMSLVLEPEIIIADEPTTALDVITQATILKLLDKLKNELSLSVIFISHDLSILSQSCDRVMIMYAGKIAETGTVDEMFYHPHHPYTKSLIHSFPDMSGRIKTLASLPGNIPDLSRETIFETRNLSKRYDLGRKGFLRFEKNYLVAVNRVNLSVRRGETHGIVGESGSGKTTLARLMMKLSEPSSGMLIYDKKDITGIRGKALREIRKKIQVIFQDPYSSLDPRKTISTLISEPMVIQQVPKHLFKEKMTQALEFVNLPLSDNFQNKYPDELSGGQRQRVGIARALIIDPEFIIADESVSMLDASIKAGIINLLLELKERKNLTYLFITHELALAYHICDRISVMHRGRIVESGTCSDVIKNPIHPYTKELIESNPPLFPDTDWIKRPRLNTAFIPDNDMGCGFLMRCPKRKNICREQSPELKDFGGGHLSTCNIA